MVFQKKFLLFGILPALLFQVVGATLYFEVWPLEPLGKAIYLATKVLLLMWPLLWWKSIKTPLQIRSKKPSRDTVYGLISGILLSLGLVLVFIIFPNKEALTLQIQNKADAYLDLSLQLYILFSLFLSLAHSLLEEYYWRWFSVKSLTQHCSPNTAILIGNLGFSAHHFIIINAFMGPVWAVLGTFGVFLGGLTWSWLYKKSDSLFASWISHICVDATIMGIGYLLLFT